MPHKDWIIELEGARVLVWRMTANGGLISFAVVLVALVGGEWTCITRYDCAHGFPHQDVLGRRAGLLYKRQFPGLDVEEIFEYAIRDCQKNFERHLDFHLAH